MSGPSSLFSSFIQSFILFYVPAFCLVQYARKSGPLFVLASSLDVLLHAAFSKRFPAFRSVPH